MSYSLADATSQVAIMFRNYAPRLQKSCKEWVRRSLNVHQAMSVVCGIGTVEMSITGQMPVYDATAPPPVKGNYRVAPMMLTYKARRAKRRSRGGGSNNGDDDDGPEWDEGGFGGSGGWNDNNDGRGGNGYGYWGSNWNEDSWWWEDASEAAFNFIYQVACWISLSQCLHFALKKILYVVQNGVDESTGDAGPFAQCSFVFINPDPKGITLPAAYPGLSRKS